MHLTLILMLLLFASAGNAQQPAVGGAVNSASFAKSDLPNGSLAQGSIFSVFGSNMGPAALAQSTSFPLPTELAGTSVQVTVGGTTVDCIIIVYRCGPARCHTAFQYTVGRRNADRNVQRADQRSPAGHCGSP